MHLTPRRRELGQEQVEPSLAYEDSNVVIPLAHGKEQSKRAKHYQLKVHFLNEQFKNGTFAFEKEKVGTKSQLADAFTKALPREDFNRYREWMGVKKFESADSGEYVDNPVPTQTDHELP